MRYRRFVKVSPYFFLIFCQKCFISDASIYFITLITGNWQWLCSRKVWITIVSGFREEFLHSDKYSKFTVLCYFHISVCNGFRCIRSSDVFNNWQWTYSYSWMSNSNEYDDYRAGWNTVCSQHCASSAAHLHPLLPEVKYFCFHTHFKLFYLSCLGKLTVPISNSEHPVAKYLT